MDDRYLLILEEVPERIQFFSIPRWEVEAEMETLKEAHGKMINADEDVEAALKIFEFLKEAYPSQPEGKWAKYLLDMSELPTHSFVGVYQVGFLL